MPSADSPGLRLDVASTHGLMVQGAEPCVLMAQPGHVVGLVCSVMACSASCKWVQILLRCAVLHMLAVPYGAVVIASWGSDRTTCPIWLAMQDAMPVQWEGLAAVFKVPG